MTQHIAHLSPGDRPEFLCDGCPRCAEYVEDMGVSFDEGRFRAFWRKMVEVEFDHEGGYASKLDKELARKLFLVALAFQRAFRVDPHTFNRMANIQDEFDNHHDVAR